MSSLSEGLDPRASGPLAAGGSCCFERADSGQAFPPPHKGCGSGHALAEVVLRKGRGSDHALAEGVLNSHAAYGESLLRRSCHGAAVRYSETNWRCWGTVVAMGHEEERASPVAIVARNEQWKAGGKRCVVGRSLPPSVDAAPFHS